MFIIQYRNERTHRTRSCPKHSSRTTPHLQHHNHQDPKHSHHHPNRQVSKAAPQSHLFLQDWRSTGRAPRRSNDSDLVTPIILLCCLWRSTCSCWRKGDLATPLWRSTGRRSDDDGDLVTPILLRCLWRSTCSCWRKGDLATPLWRSTSRSPRRSDDSDLVTPILLRCLWRITCSCWRKGDLATPVV